MPVDQPIIIHCPSCHAEAGEADRCQACGFHIEKILKRFSFAPGVRGYVTDATQSTLTQGQFKRIEFCLKSFERRFPQVRFSVFFTNLLQGLTLQEFTFWLLNSSQLSPVSDRLGKSFGILAVIDTASHATCLMTGYGLEAYLSQEDLDRSLAAASAAFGNRDYVKAIEACAASLDTTLRRYSTNSKSSAQSTTMPADPQRSQPI